MPKISIEVQIKSTKIERQRTTQSRAHRRHKDLSRGSAKPEMLAYLHVVVSQRTRVALNPSQVIQRSNLSATVFLIWSSISSQRPPQLESFAPVQMNGSINSKLALRGRGEKHNTNAQEHHTRTQHKRASKNRHKFVDLALGLHQDVSQMRRNVAVALGDV
jgi:hypothetical protein